MFWLAPVVLFLPQVGRANGIPFQTGDVLAGVGNGKIKHFTSDGVLVDTLDTGTTCAEQLGMALTPNSHLLATSSFGSCAKGTVVEFDNSGNLIGPFGGPYSDSTESIVIDASGAVYVGQPDGSRQVLKFSSTGTLVDSYNPDPQGRGTDWIDLAADQCTLRYTSEGSEIKTFNVCTKTQLPDFATGLPSPCYAHRSRPNFEELVACTTEVVRLDSAGTVIQTYQFPGTSLLFALNLDPDNKTFWTADYFNGIVFRVDIATGAIVKQFDAGVLTRLSGLAVVGEITAATTAPPTTKSYYVNAIDSKALTQKGQQLAQTQIVAGGHQESVVALLFGAPRIVGEDYGASLWGHFASVMDISSLVEDFVIGYYNSLGANRTVHVRILIVASNSGKSVTFLHGSKWAEMVNSVASWVVTQGYAGQVDIAGGSNIEFDFNGAATTRDWVDGYASLAQRYLYNIGAAYSWKPEDLWYLSWGADPAEPLPEIYNKANAAQWTSLSLYSYLQHGGSMIIAGALTESGACVQNPADATCPGDSPTLGWQQLYDGVNADARTAQTLSWSTDIEWLK